MGNLRGCRRGSVAENKILRTANLRGWVSSAKESKCMGKTTRAGQICVGYLRASKSDSLPTPDDLK